MPLRRVVSGAVALIGTVATANEFLERRVKPLGPPLERELGSYRWRGMDITYTEGGDPADDDVLLVHSVHTAGSSREFRRIFEELAEDHHVLAPDLPGFGCSDRPPLLYSAALYESFLRDFVRDVTDRPTCVATSLSGAYALVAAEQASISNLVLIAPTTTTSSLGSRVGGGLLRVPLIGTATYNMLAAKPTLRYFLGREGVYDPSTIAADDLEYFWQAAHQPGGRYAPASLVRGDLDSAVHLDDALANLDVNTTLVWGRESAIPSLHAGRRLAEQAGVKLVVIDRTRSLPHYEQPGAFLEVLADELVVPGDR